VLRLREFNSSPDNYKIGLILMNRQFLVKKSFFSSCPLMLLVSTCNDQVVLVARPALPCLQTFPFSSDLHIQTSILSAD